MNRLADGAKDSAPRTVCVCLDDFGLHTGVNQAAMILVEMHRVQAIGCLVGARAWSGWDSPLRRVADQGVDVGLHLDFTECPLLSTKPCPLHSLIVRTMLKRVDVAGIRDEIRAQLDRFERLVGRVPSFVDGHQHVHQLPVIRDELVRELSRRYAEQHPWLRKTRSVSISCGTPFFKPRLIELLGSRRLSKLSRAAGFEQNRRLLGVYDFHRASGRYRDWLIEWLRTSRSGDLLMVHPSTSHSTADRIAVARRSEFEALSSDEFDGLLQAFNIELVAMSAQFRATPIGSHRPMLPDS